MRITIVGGGNIGTQFAVHCAQAGHRVTVYTSKPEKFHTHLTIVDAQGNCTHAGDIYAATSDPAKAFEDAQVIFVTVPADCMAQYASAIAAHMTPGVKIGLIPGTGGGECVFKPCIKKGATLFGLQRVPAVARLIHYGSCVCSTGYRPVLHAAALPKSQTADCCQLLTDIFQMPCQPLPDYLNLTLTPSNPILHTTRLKTLFADYTPGTVYESIPLFYEHWSNETSQLLFRCDDEVQQLCRALTEFNLSGVRSLKEHYESETPEQMTRKIISIPAFRGLTSPQKAVDGGYIPDLSSRYFTADFSYGLAILVQIARFAGVAAPCMEQTLDWYIQLAKPSQMFCFDDFGIHDLESFLAFYRL